MKVMLFCWQNYKRQWIEYKKKFILHFLSLFENEKDT